MAKLRVHHAANASAYAHVMNSLSYQLAPRAKISRRDEGSVSDLASLKAYMRSNSFRSDPFSGGSAFGAICGRGDVDPAKPRASGCNDAKVRGITQAAHGRIVRITPQCSLAMGQRAVVGQCAVKAAAAAMLAAPAPTPAPEDGQWHGVTRGNILAVLWCCAGDKLQVGHGERG
jgi:hypothetical protein